MIAALLAAATLAATPQPAARPTARPVRIFGRYVGEFAANTSGGFQRGSAYASEVQLGVNVDFGALAHTDAGTLQAIVTERWGSGLSTNAIGNLGSVQEIYGDALTPRLTELAYAQSFANAKANVSVGRLVMQNDFAASSTYWGANLWCFYQNNAICGTPLGAPNNSGYGYYPSSQWGARIRFAPNAGFYAETGAYAVDPRYAARGQGFDLGLGGTTGIDVPLEIGTLRFAADGGLRQSLRVGGYFDASDVPGYPSYLARFVAPGNPALAVISPQRYRGRAGGWVLYDRLIAGSALPHRRGTVVWANYEYGDPQTALMSNFIDAGVVMHGTFRGRDDDALALGFDLIDINPRLRSLETALQQRGFAVPTTAQEKTVELNYTAALTPNLSVRPGLQYVVNPAGERGGYRYPGGAIGLNDALVLGLNATYTF